MERFFSRENLNTRMLAIAWREMSDGLYGMSFQSWHKTSSEEIILLIQGSGLCQWNLGAICVDPMT